MCVGDEYDTSLHGVATVSRIDKIMVSFAEYRLFYRALLQKRPIIIDPTNQSHPILSPILTLSFSFSLSLSLWLSLGVIFSPREIALADFFIYLFI